ncbi:hypothetical protein DPMN_085909 [Dreissena polymorpha]|uniref:Uncharacterized protein n=1 Tax=Dreissena polymorpha TaxID=45954 RepID=A0A9D3YHV6_DREPO|nr:hypothetical protein DPMN_085909 [Dreissena polymorpha]
MGIDWNPRLDGTNRPRRLRGNLSASRVGSSGTLVGLSGALVGSSGTLVGSSTSRNGTIHVLLGIHFQANTYLNTQSPAYIHSHRLTYIFWEWPSR